MSRSPTDPPAVDLDRLADAVDPDATAFIRISGPPRRPPPRGPSPVGPAGPPPPPRRPSLGSTSPRAAAPLARLEPSGRVGSGPPPTAAVAPPGVAGGGPPGRASVDAAAVRGLGVVVVVCAAAVLLGMGAVGLAVVGPMDGGSPAMHDLLPPPRAALAVDSGGDADDDTGSAPDPRLDDPRAGPPGAPPDRVGQTAPVTGPARPGTTSGDLVVHLPDPQGVTRVAVTCPSGFSGHSAFGAAPHVIADVPAEACTLHFRGASPYRFAGVGGGMALECTFAAGLAACR